MRLLPPQTSSKFQIIHSIDNGSSADANTIVLNPAVKFQEMDGFWCGNHRFNLLQFVEKMKPEDRTALLKETFDPVDGMGYSYIRISMAVPIFRWTSIRIAIR